MVKKITVLTTALASLMLPMAGSASAATQSYDDCRFNYACFYRYSNGGGWLYERWAGDSACGAWDFPGEYRNNTTSVYNRGSKTVYLWSETGQTGYLIAVIPPGVKGNLEGEWDNNAASAYVC
ncbi:peptidase inhibitor family I36 protein [Streptomyces sp. NPDC002787]